MAPVSNCAVAATNLDGCVCRCWCRRSRCADQHPARGRQQPAAAGAGHPSAPIILRRCLICTAALVGSCAGGHGGHDVHHGAGGIIHALWNALIAAGGLLSAHTACMDVSGGPLVRAGGDKWTLAACACWRESISRRSAHLSASPCHTVIRAACSRASAPKVTAI